MDGEAAFDAHAELPQMKRFLGLVGGADFASGAGDEVQAMGLEAVQNEDPGVNPTPWGTRLRVNSAAWRTRSEDVTAWH